MAQRPLLYYITDRTQFSGNERERRQKLLAKISEAAACAVDFIQLREKDLTGRELEALARQAVEVIRNTANPRIRLLINSRSDVALSVGADGVHLRSDDISPRDARTVATLFLGNQQAETRNWVVAVSCHSEDEVRVAAAEGADFAVFAPVFEKKEVKPAGLDALHTASRHNIPVFALGGVTLQNAKSCRDAGTAGIAGIRLFQEHDISEVVRHLSR